MHNLKCKKGKEIKKRKERLIKLSAIMNILTTNTTNVINRFNKSYKNQIVWNIAIALMKLSTLPKECQKRKCISKHKCQKHN